MGHLTTLPDSKFADYPSIAGEEYVSQATLTRVQTVS